IAGRWLQQRPGQLFKYLIVHRDRLVPIDELAEVFWPGGAPAGLGNVRYFVHVIRGALEPERQARRPASFVLAEGGAYRIDPTRVEIDADRFESFVAAGLAVASRDAARASASLKRAADLYQGDFLADEPYADWALAERDRLRGLIADALRMLVCLQAA